MLCGQNHLSNYLLLDIPNVRKVRTADLDATEWLLENTTFHQLSMIPYCRPTRSNAQAPARSPRVLSKGSFLLLFVFLLHRVDHFLKGFFRVSAFSQ